MRNTGFEMRTRPSGRVLAVRVPARGYTVVELVVVLLLLGILGASALPKFFEASRFQAMGYSDAVAGAMRYAQKIALASRCDVRVHVDAAGYALSRRARLTSDSPAPECPSGGFTVDIPRPGGQSWAGIAPSGVSTGSLDIYFDAWGSPRDTATGSLLGSSPTLAIGGRTITVEAVSGFVHAG